jgi:hypothetical protein
MSRVQTQGQFFWFAIGAYCGFLLVWSSMALFSPPSQPSERELPAVLLLMGYVPVSLVLSIPFGTWLFVRSRLTKVGAASPWLLPFILGVLYFPILFGSIPLLIWLTGQGQGNLIGTSIGAVMFGLPVLFAELTARLGRRLATGVVT